MEKIHNIEVETYCAGRWNIEIINSENNDASFFPFGKEYKKNLLTQTFYDIFGGQLPNTTARHKSPISSYSLLVARGTAVLGSSVDGQTMPQPSLSDYKLFNQTNRTSFTKQNFGLGGTTYDTNTGSATFTRTWDFHVNTAGVEKYKEAGIESWVNIIRGVTVDNHAVERTELFSRFLFPEEVIVPRGSYVRLYYSLTVRIPAIINPIPIDIKNESGDLDLTGGLKLCGNYNLIFGHVDFDGLIASHPWNIHEPERDGETHCPFFPPDGLRIKENNYIYGNYGDRSPCAVQVLPDVPFPEPGYAPNLFYSNKHIEHDKIKKTLGNIILANNPSSFGDVSFRHDLRTQSSSVCRYFFYPANPNYDSYFGGIVFGPYQVWLFHWSVDEFLTRSYYYFNNPRPGSYWYWKFNNPQQRFFKNYIIFDIRHSIQAF